MRRIACLCLFTLAAISPGCESPEISGRENVATHSGDESLDDGPFGAAMGLSKSAFGSLEELRYNIYRTDTAPRNNVLMEWYEVSFAESGLCMMTGIGVDIDTDPDGRQLRQAISKFKQALSKKYGQPDYNEVGLDDNSTLAGDEQWFAALQAEERQLRHCWLAENGEDYPHDIGSICLEGLGVENSRIGYVFIRYEFDNYPECEAMEEDQALEDL